MTVPSGRRGLSVCLLVCLAALALVACMPRPTPPRAVTSTPWWKYPRAGDSTTASVGSLTVRVPPNWHYRAQPDALTLASYDPEIENESEPAVRGRVVIRRGPRDFASLAGQLQIKPSEATIDVIEPASEVLVGGRQAVSFGMREKIYGPTYIRRHITVHAPDGEVYTFELTVAESIWPEVRPILEGVVQSATFAPAAGKP